MPHVIDTSLMQLASQKLDRFTKKSFVPADQLAGGAAGMLPPGADPMMGGGGMDPAAMMGGGMDPAAMMGGAPPMDPMMMGMPPEQPPAPPTEEPKKDKKLDPAILYNELTRVRKLLTGLYQQLGLHLPEDILDDESTLAPGISDAPAAPPAQSQDPGGFELPAIGNTSSVSPIEPAQATGAGTPDLGQKTVGELLGMGQ